MRKISYKDKDLMSDTGGKTKHYELSKDKPPRDKNPGKEKMQTNETRDDMSMNDPDLKLACSVFAKLGKIKNIIDKKKWCGIYCDVLLNKHQRFKLVSNMNEFACNGITFEFSNDAFYTTDDYYVRFTIRFDENNIFNFINSIDFLKKFFVNNGVCFDGNFSWYWSILTEVKK